MWTLIYISVDLFVVPCLQVVSTEQAKQFVMKKPSAPQPAAFLCVLRNFITLKTQAHIRTFKLFTGHQYRHYVCIHKLFICTDDLLHSDLSLHFFNFPGSISNVSSQEHLTTVLGLITCWFCFIKTFSHTSCTKASSTSTIVRTRIVTPPPHLFFVFGMLEK